MKDKSGYMYLKALDILIWTHVLTFWMFHLNTCVIFLFAQSSFYECVTNNNSAKVQAKGCINVRYFGSDKLVY